MLVFLHQLNGIMSILKFKKLLEEDKKAKELNQSLGYEKYNFGSTEYTFNLAAYHHPPGISIRSLNEKLIELDEEDINYLKDKYFKKLEEEKQKEIEAIELKYKL